MTITKPVIETGSDYDGYFTSTVRQWCDEKTTPFKSERIIVTAGPYRASAVTCWNEGPTLHIDFYSALRAGFGSLSDADVDNIKEHWL